MSRITSDNARMSRLTMPHTRKLITFSSRSTAIRSSDSITNLLVPFTWVMRTFNTTEHFKSVKLRRLSRPGFEWCIAFNRNRVWTIQHLHSCICRLTPQTLNQLARVQLRACHFDHRTAFFLVWTTLLWCEHDCVFVGYTSNLELCFELRNDVFPTAFAANDTLSDYRSRALWKNAQLYFLWSFGHVGLNIHGAKICQDVHQR